MHNITYNTAHNMTPNCTHNTTHNMRATLHTTLNNMQTTEVVNKSTIPLLLSPIHGLSPYNFDSIYVNLRSSRKFCELKPAYYSLYYNN